MTDLAVHDGPILAFTMVRNSQMLCLLPRWPKHRVLELAPVNWKATWSDRR